MLKCPVLLDICGSVRVGTGSKANNAGSAGPGFGDGGLGSDGVEFECMVISGAKAAGVNTDEGFGEVCIWNPSKGVGAAAKLNWGCGCSTGAGLEFVGLGVSSDCPKSS